MSCCNHHPPSLCQCCLPLNWSDNVRFIFPSMQMHTINNSNRKLSTTEMRHSPYSKWTDHQTRINYLLRPCLHFPLDFKFKTKLEKLLQTTLSDSPSKNATNINEESLGEDNRFNWNLELTIWHTRILIPILNNLKGIYSLMNPYNLCCDNLAWFKQLNPKLFNWNKFVQPKIVLSKISEISFSDFT